MDWYYGNGIDELVVPQYQDISDRLPSPDSWSKWGTTTSERIGSPNKWSPNKCFLQDSNLKEQELSLDGNSLCNEVELDTFHDKDDSNGSSICEGLLEGAFYWRSPSHDRPDYQLDDLEGVEQTNDIFLSSLLEDLPEMEAIDESFEFSPETPQCGGLPSDNLDSRSMWIDVNNTVGKSKYPKRHAFSPLMGRDNQDVKPCNSEQMDCAPIKFGEDIVSSEQNSLNENSGQEKSPEESVLEELEMVMAQLTEKTQICFRDALYRLAKNSEHHDMETQEEGGYLDTEKPPPWTLHDIKMRPASQKAMESETNAIDRAVANLMFNDMDFSVIREHSSSASVNFTEGVIGEREPPVNSNQNVVRSTKNVVRSTRPMDYSFNQPKIQHVSHRSISRGDAEVPRLAQIDRDTEFM